MWSNNSLSTPKDSVFSATFTGLSIHWNVLWSETAAAAAPPVAQLSQVMQGFKVGCFLVWAILASRGRAHQSYLSGGTKACLCSPQRGLVFCFLFFCILVSSPLPFSRFMLPVVLKEKKSYGRKVKLYITSLQNILDDSLWKDKSTKCACVRMQVCAFVCVQSLWLLYVLHINSQSG